MQNHSEMEATCPTDVPVPRPVAPIYPRWVRRQQPLVTKELVQFIALSMALHMLAIALFGAPGGGNREGRAMWGPLSVVIRDSWRDAGPSLKMERELPPLVAAAPERKPAPAERRVPSPPPAPPVDLGMAKSLQTPVAVPPAPPVEAPPAPPKSEPATPRFEAAPPAVEAPYGVPPLLERLPVPDRMKDLAPAPKLPPPTVEPRASPSPGEFPRVSPSPLGEGRGEGQRPTPPPVPKAEVPAPAPVVPLPPLTEPALLDRVVAPRVERQLAEPPTLPAPVIPPITPPAPVIPQPVAPPVPVIQQPVAPPAPVMPPVPVERAPVEAPAVPAITPPVARPPVEVPSMPVPRDDLAAPPRLQPVPRASEPATRPEVAAPRVAPEATRIEPPPAPVRDPVPRPDLRTSPAPESRPSPSASEPRFSPSAPGGGRGEAERSPPSSTYDPTAPAPTIDLDAARRRAGELSRQGTGNKAPLAFPMPPVPAKKSKMETAIENARKPDCREAYKSLGLAAVVPLIANEFGEGNCRW